MKMDFTSANNYCESKGFHLLFIESSEEEQFVETTLNYITDDKHHWIGMTRANDTAEKVWMDGLQVTFDQISTSDDGNLCYRLAKRTSGANEYYEWDDHPCDDELHFICEINGEQT